MEAENFPGINISVFESYCKFKRQGVVGQQEKAHKLFTSGKIVNVKTIKKEQLYICQGSDQEIIWKCFKTSCY